MVKKFLLFSCIMTISSAMEKPLCDDKPLSFLETLFIRAAKDGDEVTVRECIAQNVDINVLDQHGESALYNAAYYHRWTTLALLLKQPKIIVDVKSKTAGKKLTVFHLLCNRVLPAAEQMQAAAIKLMVEKKADLNILDDYQETPLLRLIGLQAPASLIEYLVDAGARLQWSGTAISQQSPLTQAAHKSPAHVLAVLKSFDLKLADIQQAGLMCYEGRRNKLHNNAELALIKRYFIVMNNLGYVNYIKKNQEKPPLHSEWRASPRASFAQIPLQIAKRIAYFATRNIAQS